MKNLDGDFGKLLPFHFVVIAKEVMEKITEVSDRRSLPRRTQDCEHKKYIYLG
jgi:hypothetical protein